MRRIRSLRLGLPTERPGRVVGLVLPPKNWMMNVLLIAFFLIMSVILWVIFQQSSLSTRSAQLTSLTLGTSTPASGGQFVFHWSDTFYNCQCESLNHIVDMLRVALAPMTSSCTRCWLVGWWHLPSQCNHKDDTCDHTFDGWTSAPFRQVWNLKNKIDKLYQHRPQIAWESIIDLLHFSNRFKSIHILIQIFLGKKQA